MRQAGKIGKLALGQVNDYYGTRQFLREVNSVMHGRRQFLRNSLLGTAALLIARSSPFSFAADSPADSRIDILLGEPLGTDFP